MPEVEPPAGTIEYEDTGGNGKGWSSGTIGEVRMGPRVHRFTRGGSL